MRWGLVRRQCSLNSSCRGTGWVKALTAFRVGLNSWLFFLDLEVPRADALNCGRRGETSFIDCRSWTGGFITKLSTESVDTLPLRRLAGCWGLIVLDDRSDLYSSELLSRLSGRPEDVSSGSLPFVDAIGLRLGEYQCCAGGAKWTTSGRPLL